MTNRLPTIGDRVRAKVCDFEGIVTTHARHLAGCDRLFVIPRVGADGKFVEGMWCDIDMLTIIEPNAVEPVTYDRTAPGGIDLPPTR